MNVHQLHELFQHTLGNNDQQRKHAETSLKELRWSPGFLTGLIQIANSSEVNIAIRQAAVIYFKNQIKRFWDPAIKKAHEISEDDKMFIREHVLDSLIFSGSPLIRSHYQESIRCIAEADFPSRWPTIIPNIGQNLQSNEEIRVYGSLVALAQIFRKYQYLDNAQAGRELAELTSFTFPFLQALFAHLLNQKSVDAAEMMRFLCKIFLYATRLALPSFVRDPNVFSAWVTMITQLLAIPIPSEQPENVELRSKWPWWTAKQKAIMNLRRIFVRFGSPQHHSPGPDQEIAKLFLNNFAPAVLTTCIGVLDQRRQGQWVQERVVNLCLAFVSVSVQHGVTYRVMRPHLEVLLFEIIFPLLSYTSEDEELWQEDDREYIRKECDIMEDFWSARSAAVLLLQALAKRRGFDSVVPFLQFAASVMFKYSSGQATPQQKEGAMFGVGALAEYLMQKEKYKGQIEPMLLHHVFPEFHSANPFLRGRSLWVYGHFALSEFTDMQHLKAVVEGVVNALTDKETPVQFQAALALRMFAQNEMAASLLQPLLPRLFRDLLALMSKVDNSELVATLSQLVESYGDAIAPFAHDLVSNLGEHFIRLASGEDDDEETAIDAAFACLESLVNVLDSVSETPSLYLAFENVLVPLLDMLLRPDFVDYFEKTMEILTYLTFYPEHISPAIWRFYPRLYHSFCGGSTPSLQLNEPFQNGWTYDYLREMATPLENFATKEIDVFLTLQNPETGISYMDMFCKMIAKAFVDLNAMDTSTACKLVCALFDNCAGKVDAAVFLFLEMGVRALQEKLNQINAKPRKTPKPLDRNFALPVLTMILDIIHYNPVMSFQFLESKGVLGFTFQMILSFLQEFSSYYPLKRCLLGLTGILRVPVAGLPESLRPFIPDICKSYLNICMQLSELKDTEEEEEHGDGDSDVEEKQLKPEEDAFSEEDEDDMKEFNKRIQMRKEEIAALKAMKASQGEEFSDEEDDDLLGGIDCDQDFDDDSNVTALDEVNEILFLGDCLQRVQETDIQSFQILLSVMGQDMWTALQVTFQGERDKVMAEKAEEAQRAAEEAAKGNRK